MHEPLAPKRVLCIHDLSGIGRSSLANILPILAVMGHQPVALPTALLSTHTGGLGEPARLHTEEYASAALDHYAALELGFDCIYSGYLSNTRQQELVKKAYSLWPDAYKVVDPVMGDDNHLYSGITEDFCEGMRQLCKMADLVIPNCTEAGILLGTEMPQSFDRAAAEQAALRLTQQYPAAVVTGLPMGKTLGNAGALRGRSPFFVQRIRIGSSYPGTGDIFAAVLVGCLLKGNALSAAVDLAAGFVADCIEATPAKADSRLGVWIEPQLYRLANSDSMATGRE